MAQLAYNPGRPRVIASTTVATPPHTLTRDDVKPYTRDEFEIDDRRAVARLIWPKQST